MRDDESARRNVSGEEAVLMAEFFGVSVGWLLGEGEKFDP